jgi:hypothetical protein
MQDKTKTGKAGIDPASGRMLPMVVYAIQVSFTPYFVSSPRKFYCSHVMVAASPRSFVFV